MATTKKKTNRTPEEIEASKRVKKENEEKVKKALEARKKTLREAFTGKLLENKICFSDDIDISFVAEKGASYFLMRSGCMERLRITDGDIIQLNCKAEARNGDPCVAIVDGEMLYLLKNDASVYVNVCSQSADEDIVELQENEYIGKIVNVLPAN